MDINQDIPLPVICPILHLSDLGYSMIIYKYYLIYESQWDSMEISVKRFKKAVSLPCNILELCMHYLKTTIEP